jgi:uncharacterized protein
MLLGRLTLALVVLAGPALAQDPLRPQPPQIVTAAQAEQRVKPDRASITIGVQTRATTAAEAAAQNARKQRAIIDAIKARGVPAEQITTSNFNVSPEQRYREGLPPLTTGFLVSNDVSVDLKVVDQVGPVIDAALASGANQINSLWFGVANPDSARRVALALAVAKARADAEAMARAAGGTLGGLLELTSTEMYVPPIPRPMMAMARMAVADQAQTPIESGEQLIRASVSGRWRFIEAGSP